MWKSIDWDNPIGRTKKLGIKSTFQRNLAIIYTWKPYDVIWPKAAPPTPPHTLSTDYTPPLHPGLDCHTPSSNHWTFEHLYICTDCHFFLRLYYPAYSVFIFIYIYIFILLIVYSSSLYLTIVNTVIFHIYFLLYRFYLFTFSICTTLIYLLLLFTTVLPRL